MDGPVVDLQKHFLQLIRGWTEDSSWTELTSDKQASSEPQLGEEPPAAEQTPQAMRTIRINVPKQPQHGCHFESLLEPSCSCFPVAYLATHLFLPLLNFSSSCFFASCNMRTHKSIQCAGHNQPSLAHAHSSLHERHERQCAATPRCCALKSACHSCD